VSRIDVKRRFVIAVSLAAVGSALLSLRADAAGASEEPGAKKIEETTGADERDRDVFRRRLIAATRRHRYFDLFATVMVGDGLRLNNPYRLAHELGSNAESVSSTQPYLDVAVAATTGPPNGLQHGLRLGWSLSTSGVPQQVVTPAYLALVRLPESWVLYGWAGFPVLLEPDLNVGGEVALGGSWLARAGLGATAALVADAFYGAATRDTRAALYPVISAQVGVFINYEVLP
jgi:hypothetical protein